MHLPRLNSRLVITIGCSLLVAVIGYGDFREGDEGSMLLFYMIPIALATWYGGTTLGLVMVALTLAADLISDRVAGVPNSGPWNLGTSFLYDIVFVVLLSRWHSLVNNMHARVEERTADLKREIAARKELEREVASVTEHERRRLGQELHDSLCQHLTGTALKAQTVVKQVQMGDDCAAANARDIVTLVDRGIEIARDIARGLFSSELEGEGLISALEGLAETTSRQHQIACSFQHSAELAVSPEKSTQLYWIAREAVTNAVRHAAPKHIKIRLNRAGQDIELCVDDDGDGIDHSGGDGNGIGLQVMRQRAELAGGSLRTTHNHEGGTAVRCVISLDS